jgi:hypothetical protein
MPKSLPILKQLMGSLQSAFGCFRKEFVETQGGAILLLVWYLKTPSPNPLTFNMVIKPEDRQLIANFVNNLTADQRREILRRLLKTRFKRILTEDDGEKNREPLEQNAEPRQQETRAFETEKLPPAD